MSSDRFGKWWPCLRKHSKRTRFWLPHAKRLQVDLNGDRLFRYFTLCARPMIDVYMLIKEQVLLFDEQTRRVQGAFFCECDEEIFPEMKELIGVEEAGFLATLEDLILFKDISETQTLDSDEALTNFMEEAGEGLDEAIRKKIEEKKRHLQFQKLFPFDFLNLDFCDRYYGEPPDVMKIHGAIERLLEWQRRPGKTSSGQEFSIQKFVVAITCRVDLKTPADVLSRLKRMVSNNSVQNPEYKAAIEARQTSDLDKWASDNPMDFFMAAWPKEIARMAKEKCWDIKIRGHVFYDRQNDHGQDYKMVCLIAEFTQTAICKTYLEAVTTCLRTESRTFIPKIEPYDGEGVTLLSNLRDVVKLRNKQAEIFSRDQLPDPLVEINRLKSEGVPI